MAQRFDHNGGVVRAGADGELTVVTREKAAWIRVHGRDTGGIDQVTITEEYAGVIYDGRPIQENRFAVAVHTSGAYRVDIVDKEGRPGGFHVGPGDFEDGDVLRESVATGKIALLRQLREELLNLRELARSLRTDADEQDHLQVGLGQAVEEIDAAISHALEGVVDAANEQIAETVETLEETREYVLSEEQRLYDSAAVAAIDPRLGEAIQRARTAIETPLAQ